MGELSLTSRLPDSGGRTLRPYLVDDIDTVGVHGKEPCSIVFANRNSQKVEIRISVDGTDVNSGKQATLDPRDGTPTWVVASNGFMQLHAWPETTKGGAEFVFSNPADSVAAHTHGDLGALGYVSVAVFHDDAAYVAPVYRGGGGSSSHHMFGPTRGATRGEMKSAGGPGMGAGEFVEQAIGSARGLIRPVLNRVVQLRYMWWDDLVARLEELKVEAPVQHPTGFLPDRGEPLADLGTTPRPESTSTAVAERYPRFI